MKQLLEMNKIIFDMLGLQSEYCGTSRPMKYCVKVETSAGIVIYNCITLEMIQINPQEYGVDKYLFEHWFTVPDNFNEKEWFNDIRTKIKKKDMARPLHRFTIFTTTECNARCFYCYENGVFQQPMPEKIAYDTASFIANQYKGELHRLHWFGGEPLCNVRAIDIISDQLIQKKVRFNSTMTSNGYLFDDEIIEKAVRDWHLSDVQITLDGTREQYNRIKNYKNDDPDPFERVIGNISKLLSRKIAVKVRLNIGLYNIQGMLQLVDMIKTNFGSDSLLYIYPALVDKYKHEYTSEEKQERNEQFRIVQQHLEASGLHYKRKSIDNVLRITNCVGDDYRGCVILPNGKLSKCATLMESEVYGDIYMPKAEYDAKVIESWQERGTEISQCDDCCIYPLCSKRLYKCPSDRKNPIYEYECATRIFDYVSTVKSLIEKKI